MSLTKEQIEQRYEYLYDSIKYRSDLSPVYLRELRDMALQALAPVEPAEATEPDMSKVICPNCCHQFAAISVNDQHERSDLESALALARQEAEANRREPKWWTDAIPTPELRCLIKNGANVAQQRYRVMSLAGLVSHMFGIGHTHATEICQRAGLDPYRDARKGALDAAKAGEK